MATPSDSGVVSVGPDPEDDAWMVQASIKSNLGRRPTSLRFRLAVPGGTCRLEWRGTSALTGNELLTLRVPEEKKTALARAKEFLLKFLEKGRQPADLCCIEGLEQGVSHATLKRAAKRLGIIQKQGRHSTGVYDLGTWELPSSAAP